MCFLGLLVMACFCLQTGTKTAVRQWILHIFGLNSFGKYSACKIDLVSGRFLVWRLRLGFNTIAKLFFGSLHQILGTMFCNFQRLSNFQP